MCLVFQALAACTKACEDVLALVQCPGAARVISEGGEWSGVVVGGGGNCGERTADSGRHAQVSFTLIVGLFLH